MAGRRRRGEPAKPIDLVRVKRARAELERIARKHPHLVGPSSKENRAGWESALQEDEMAAAKMVAFRLQDELIERLDAYAARIAADAGITVTRSDVAKKLLLEGLDRVEGGAKKSRKR